MSTPSHEPPKPYHPQSRFGSGVQTAALAYPNLAAYYGEDFAPNFTTMDLLDSMAARLKILEDFLEEAQRANREYAQEVGQQFGSILEQWKNTPRGVGIQPVKMPRRLRLLYWLMRRAPLREGKYPDARSG